MQTNSQELLDEMTSFDTYDSEEEKTTMMIEDFQKLKTKLQTKTTKSHNMKQQALLRRDWSCFDNGARSSVSRSLSRPSTARLLCCACARTPLSWASKKPS